MKFGIAISPTVSPLMINREHIVTPDKVLSSSSYVKIINVKLMGYLTRTMRASDQKTHCRQVAADHQNEKRHKMASVSNIEIHQVND